MARPTDFKPEYVELVENYCLLGAIDDELAAFFDVSTQTLNAWKKAHPEFLDAMARGKHMADAKVARKLFHRACGYEHPEDDIRAVNGEIVITPMVKHYPPDTTAGMFWLKNRQRDKWKDKHEEVGGENMAEIISKLIDKMPS